MSIRVRLVDIEDRSEPFGAGLETRECPDCRGEGCFGCNDAGEVEEHRMERIAREKEERGDYLLAQIGM